MLNISSFPNRLKEQVADSPCMEQLDNERVGKKTISRFMIGLAGFVLFLFLPWTQNVSAPGKVISRYPDKKPQQVNSLIDGRIAKWHVYEGQVIQPGDTIVQLTEVKAEYLDPQLIQRTEKLLDAKTNGIAFQEEKLEALRSQESALINSRDLELAQTRLKVRQSMQKVLADSAALEQESLSLDIAKERYKRAQELFNDGLLSTTDFESRRLKQQESMAKYVKAENTLLSTRQALEMASLEVNRKAAMYADKIAKNRSDQATTASKIQDSIAEQTKLENTLANYKNRQTGQVILAPQGGRVVQTLSSGVGEIIKAGTAVSTIQPLDFSEAVELYVDAMDVPLMHKDATVRIQFDGWPALVFSGWPNASVGTFAGKISSVDQVINANGKYRIIIVPEHAEDKWPQPLSIGSGSYGMIMLKDVPLGYELWRQLNGFPPEYYTVDDVAKKGVDKKH